MAVTASKEASRHKNHPLLTLHQLLVSIKSESDFRAREGQLLDLIHKGHLAGNIPPITAVRLQREATQPFTYKRGFSICQCMASTIDEIIRSSPSRNRAARSPRRERPTAILGREITSAFINLQRHAKRLGRHWMLSDLPYIGFGLNLRTLLNHEIFVRLLDPSVRTDLDNDRYSPAELLGSVLLLLSSRSAAPTPNFWVLLAGMKWDPEIKTELFTASGSPTPRFLALLRTGAEYLGRFGLKHHFHGDDPDSWIAAFAEQRRGR